MAMSAGNGNGGVAEINVTPLIDVLLVLLIIFMILVPLAPRGMQSAVPQPGNAAQEPSMGPVMLEVHQGTAGAPGAAGGVSPGITYRVDGRPVDAAMLAGTLRARLAIRQEPALLVSGDRSLTYNDVAQAVAVAREAGAAPIGLVNTAASGAGR